MARPKKIRVTNITLSEEEWMTILDTIEYRIDSDVLDGDPAVYPFQYNHLGKLMLLHDKLSDKVKNKFGDE